MTDLKCQKIYSSKSDFNPLKANRRLQLHSAHENQTNPLAIDYHNIDTKIEGYYFLQNLKHRHTPHDIIRRRQLSNRRS